MAFGGLLLAADGVVNLSRIGTATLRGRHRIEELCCCGNSSGSCEDDGHGVFVPVTLEGLSEVHQFSFRRVSLYAV